MKEFVFYCIFHVHGSTKNSLFSRLVPSPSRPYRLVVRPVPDITALLRSLEKRPTISSLHYFCLHWIGGLVQHLSNSIKQGATYDIKSKFIHTPFSLFAVQSPDVVVFNYENAIRLLTIFSILFIKSSTSSNCAIISSM